MSLLKFTELPSLGDERGSLVAVEACNDIPFEIKRVYYIFKTQNDVSRGFHAHKKLKQLVVCVSGKCRMILDDGKRQEETWLDNPTQGLIIEDMTWREIHDFSEDCVLLVLANEYYDESDYIRDYSDFVKRVSS